MRGTTVIGLVSGALVALTLAAAAQPATNSAVTVSPAPCKVPAPAAATPPATPSIAAGTSAARNRDFAMALVNFKPLAENGDADAERAMGQLLMQDCTGLQDKPAAVDWLTKAAAAGNVSAQNQLASAYLRGQGVAQDDTKAFALYSQTAASGNAVGEMQLGYMYFSGRGVPQDKYQGLQWTVKAAEQSNGIALSNIALAYFRGEIVEKDLDRAAYFLALANERTNPAQRAEVMGTSELIRQGVSADDLGRAVKRAQRWTPGAGSLRDVLSDAEDFRRKAAKLSAR